MENSSGHWLYRSFSRNSRVLFYIFLITAFFTVFSFGSRYMEKLNRGVVAVRVNANSVYIGWRMFGTDPSGIAFNVYRGGVKVNAAPISVSTNYTDTTAANSTYYIKPVIGGVEQAQSETVSIWAQQYLTIPIQQPPMQTMPDGVTCTSTANDCSVGDLDGDGEYEIVLKWDPTNSKDNSQSGYTGDVYLDAYKLNGTRLWRIDLGPNIRAGAHYTQFMVYDLNSDGKAEVVCKTAPGTKDSTGNYLSLGPAATDNDGIDYRNTAGYILSGPEYLTLFKGDTGKEAATINYNPPRGTVSAWGDNYGNRVDRFLACVAYLDGVHPSVVMCRGYYTRAVLVAYDWNGMVLSQRWIFDSNTAGNAAYAGQGNHNLSVGDIDGDGKDEIVYGAAAIDHDGKGIYSTGLGHGDASHLGKMDPDRAGLQVFDVHESPSANSGGEYRDAGLGTLLWGYPATGDTGRGMAADIDAAYRGWEYWSASTDGVYNINGTRISTAKPSVNFRIYWDGDLQDELLDGTKLDKWNGNGTSRLFTFYNYRSSQEINGTKANPCLSADILGDWREEVIYRNSNNQELNVFTTTTATTYRFYTLMHDIMYRLGVAWQNVAYNQPPHVSFYSGDGPLAQPTGDIIYPAGLSPTVTNTVTAALTVTATRTASFTPSPTLTRSMTQTIVSTYTASVLPSFTFTQTQTLTADSTATETASPALFTPGMTGTTTLVDTITYTVTKTFTISPSWTFTILPSCSVTSTNTATCTPTLIETNTPVETGTLIPSPTDMKTETYTPSKTAVVLSFTITCTVTAAITLANTLTVTFSNNTATLIATRTAIPSTPTVTQTMVVPEKNSITKVVSYPNPLIAKKPLNVVFNISHDSPAVYFSLYTVSFRLIRRLPLSPAQAGINNSQIPASVFLKLACGTYYYYIEGTDYSGKKNAQRG